MRDYSKLHSICDGIPMLMDVPMKEHTTFRVGGKADVFFMPRNDDDVIRITQGCKEENIPCFIFGGGANLLVSDDGFRGAAVQIKSGLNEIRKTDEDTYSVGAGHMLSVFASRTIDEGFGSLAWAVGIPGTIGGAVAMNAGAYGGEMKDVIKSVTIVEDGEVKTLPVKDGDMGYRYSRFHAPNAIVLSATFKLTEDDGTAKARMEECMRLRREKQPLNYPSAGSTFKRPEGHFAGALIEQSGLKGYRIGGATVSDKHAGFIVNTGGATAEDILKLMNHVQDKVYADFGVMLEAEVRTLGFEEK